MGSAHPFLLIKDFSLLVQVHHSQAQCSEQGEHGWDCRSGWLLCLSSTLSPPLAASLQLQRHLGELWCLPKAHLAVPAQPLGNAGR